MRGEITVQLKLDIEYINSPGGVDITNIHSAYIEELGIWVNVDAIGQLMFVADSKKDMIKF